MTEIMSAITLVIFQFCFRAFPLCVRSISTKNVWYWLTGAKGFAQRQTSPVWTRLLQPVLMYCMCRWESKHTYVEVLLGMYKLCSCNWFIQTNDLSLQCTVSAWKCTFSLNPINWRTRRPQRYFLSYLTGALFYHYNHFFCLPLCLLKRCYETQWFLSSSVYIFTRGWKKKCESVCSEAAT